MRGEFVGFYIDIHLFLKSVWMRLEISVKNSSDRTEICKISYNFLTLATIWDVMLKKEYGLQKTLRISKLVVNY